MSGVSSFGRPAERGAKSIGEHASSCSGNVESYKVNDEPEA